MTTTDAFALQKSDLNGFLFADIGVEENGNTLSVLSALARTGADPWQEGGRLARKSRAAAIRDLAAIIAATPLRLSPGEDPNAVAVRLAGLLPVRGVSVRSGADPSVVPSMRPMPEAGWASANWVVVLAVVMSLIAGLTLNVTGQIGGGAKPASEAVVSSPARSAPGAADHIERK